MARVKANAGWASWPFMGTLGACVLVLVLVQFAGMWVVRTFGPENEVGLNLHVIGFVLLALIATKCEGGFVPKLVVFVLAYVLFLMILLSCRWRCSQTAQPRPSVRSAKATEP